MKDNKWLKPYWIVLIFYWICFLVGIIVKLFSPLAYNIILIIEIVSLITALIFLIIQLIVWRKTEKELDRKLYQRIREWDEKWKQQLEDIDNGVETEE